MNRRDFMVRSALLAAGSGTMGALAHEGAKIRCGVLGLGHAHALDVVEVLKASGDFELAGVCEPDAAVRGEVENSPALQGVHWLTQDELFGEDALDMVAVEGAVERLLEYAQSAAEAGKHIHLDKPAGTSLPAFRTLLDTVEQRKLLLQMGYMFRYNAGFDFVRHAVAEGLLGDVFRISASMDTDYTPDKRKLLAGRPGGTMFELGCHLLDMTMLMLGTPTKVTPFLRHDTKHTDDLLDNTTAVFEFDAAVAVLASSAMRPNSGATRRFEVCGTNGSVTIEPLEPPSVRLNLREARGEYRKGIQVIRVPDYDRHVRDFEDLARCIRGEAEYAYTRQHDWEVQQALLRASGQV